MKKPTQTVLLFVFITFLSCTIKKSDYLTVHEWGTITTKHSAGGAQYGGLNIINSGEELPSFVYRLHTEIPVLADYDKGPPPVQGNGNPNVTMRLETPVIYFYPTQEFDESTSFDVEVNFKGGLINEYYPSAKAQASEIVTNGLKPDNSSSLIWKNVTLKPPLSPSLKYFPETSNPVWLAPRKTTATPACISNNNKTECEKYLFYRGVASLSSIFLTNLYENNLTIYLGAFFQGTPSIDAPLWIVDVQKPGTLAFVEKKFPSNQASLNHTLTFTEKDYSETSYQNLRASMRQALIKEGLFEDEAEAMLNTWDHSYFKQPGKRIFYIAPKAWVDKYLPLKISVPHKLTRVIVGRIDLEK